jgi:hypothetical protein
LNDLDSKHDFHRQFSEKFPELHKEQILGMQLYWLMLTNEMIWVYTEIQHAGHAFPHSTYFIPKKQVQKYVELCKNNGAIIP